MSLAAVAAGADALMIEVQPRSGARPDDGEQALVPEVFADLVRRIRAVASAIGRTV